MERYVFRLVKEDFPFLVEHDGHSMIMVFASDTDLEILCDCDELAIRVCEPPTEEPDLERLVEVAHQAYCEYWKHLYPEYMKKGAAEAIVRAILKAQNTPAEELEEGE